MMIKYAVKLLKNSFNPVNIPDGVEICHGDLILVRTEKGEEVAKVEKVCSCVAKKWEGKAPEALPFIKVLSSEDKKRYDEIQLEQKEAYKTCLRLISEHNLSMNLVEVKIFEFELLTYSPTTERIAIPLQENLRKLGIEMNIRQVDTSQFVNRWHEHDFDMVSMGYRANYYPSSGLQITWQSDFIDSTYNQANVTDPAVDYLIKGIVDNQADDEALLHWGRALDRVLMWNHYMIPQWHLSKFRIAYINKFSRPNVRPKYALGTDYWWLDVEKEKALNK